jgi:hypothetical protein
MRTISRRLSALVAASAISLTGVALTAGSAQAVADPRPQNQATSWLIGGAPNGVYYNAQFDFNDYGLGADTAISLATVGGHDAAVTKLGDALRDNYYNFVTGGQFGPDDLAGGSMGKALVVAQVAGTKPAGYAKRVQSDVEDLLGTTAPIVGRIQNDASYDANVFGQAYVARGLATAASADTADAVNFLLLQQCTDGHFREKFSPKADVDQSCDAGLTDTTGDSVGATATAVINLQAIVGKAGVPAGAATAITKGLAWLVSVQNPDGSWGTDGGNANNTGLAGWALAGAPEAVEAAQWLRAHEADDTDGCTKIGAANVGAVALGQSSLADGRTSGITVNTIGEWQRATSQSLVALGSLPAPASTPNLVLTGPAGYVQGGKAASYKVTGAVAGSKVCVEILGKGSVATAAASGAVTVPLALTAATGTRAVRVTDANGHVATTSTKVLGAKILAVKPAAKRVKKGKSVRVTVSGLAAGETVTLRYRGVVVATGKATTAGTFARTVKVGKKTGKATIAAFGQFSTIRKGANTITVTR